MKKAENIRFTGEGEYFESNQEQVDRVHAIGILAVDFTLCGMDTEGDEGSTGNYEVVNLPVDCPNCVKIIKYCKKIKYRE